VAGAAGGPSSSLSGGAASGMGHGQGLTGSKMMNMGGVGPPLQFEGGVGSHKTLGTGGGAGTPPGRSRGARRQGTHCVGWRNALCMSQTNTSISKNIFKKRSKKYNGLIKNGDGEKNLITTCRKYLLVVGSLAKINIRGST